MILSGILHQVNTESSIIGPEKMKNWIDENKILSNLFDPNNYSLKTIKRSESILKFYIYQGYFDNEMIDNF